MPANHTNIRLFSTFLALLAGLAFSLAAFFCLGTVPRPAMAASLPRPPVVVSNLTASTPTTMTLVSSPNPSALGQMVTFTATVHTLPGANMLTGSVQFKFDGVNLSAPVTLFKRKASLSTSWSAKVIHTITAVYSGDANYSISSAAPIVQCCGCAAAGGTNIQDSFILSNEPPVYLIHKLIAAGYGNYNLSDCLVAIRNDTEGSGQVLTDAFLKALSTAPVQSQIFTTSLSHYDFDGAVAVNTDGTAQIVDVFGQGYDGKPGFTPLRTEMSGVGKVNFISPTDPQVPLTSWNIVTTYDGSANVVTTTYNAFGVVWAAINELYFPLVQK